MKSILFIISVELVMRKINVKSYIPDNLLFISPILYISNRNKTLTTAAYFFFK